MAEVTINKTELKTRLFLTFSGFRSEIEPSNKVIETLRNEGWESHTHSIYPNYLGQPENDIIHIILIREF